MSIGRRVRRLDWDEVTSGRARFTDDLDSVGGLVARFLRSTIPHARILDIDVTAAEAAPGVVAVITAREIGLETRYTHSGGELADRRPLAWEKVRYIGEEIAVAAESRSQADHALGLIQVRYRRLPAVFTPQTAQASGASTIHTHRPDNVAARIHRRYGNQSATPGEVAVSGRYYFARQTHAAMETNRTTARWDPGSKTLEIWTSTEAPYFIRKEVSDVLGLTRDQVKIRDVAVGGGFGSKSKISEHEVLVAELAVRAPGRPVSVVYDREEEFSATKPRHDFIIDLTTTATSTGQLVTNDATMVVDNGAYNHCGPAVMGVGASVLASLYRRERVAIDGELVYTNKQPGSQFRGYGTPQATFAIESQIDELAERLGVDPIDLRVANVHHSGEVTLAGWVLADAHIEECLETVRHVTNWDEKRLAGGAGRRIGVAISIHPSGSFAFAGADLSEALVTIRSDGRVIAGFGSADSGTGQRTVVAQAVASELGIQPAEVQVVMMDSDRTPVDMGAWSSRGTVMAIGAAGAAARDAARVLISLAAAKLGAPAEKVRLVGGKAVSGDDALDLGDLVLVSRVNELNEINRTADGTVRIGAGVHLQELLRSSELAEYSALQDAVATIASPQVREMATVGGNLCQEKRCWFYRNEFSCYKRAGRTAPCYAVLGDHRFFHAVLGAHRCQAVTPSDLATVFGALDATVEVAAPERNNRCMSVLDLYSGPGETVLGPSELLTAVVLPPLAGAITAFEKLAHWEGDFAVTSACTFVRHNAGVVTDVRVVLGAVAPIAYRATASERALLGNRLDSTTIDRAADVWAREADPLSGNYWKVEATVGLLRRCLHETAHTIGKVI